MCEIITIGGRLAHASSLTYRFWGDASREESLFGVTPRARRHPKKCEASPQRLRVVTPKMEGWPLTSFSKIIFFRSKPAKGTHCALLGMQLPDEDRNMMISRSSGRSGFIYMVNV